MTPEDFKEYMKNKDDGFDYGLMPQPLPAQEALDILITHFLGNDWCVVASCGQEQVNTEAVYDILWSYPKKSNVFVNLKSIFGGNKNDARNE